MSQNFSLSSGILQNNGTQELSSEIDSALLAEICRSCPKLLYLLNACPVFYGLRVDKREELDEHGYNSGVVDFVMVGASVLNCVALAMIWITLLKFKTTRSFCLAACNFVSFLLVNHASRAFEEPRPSGSCTSGDFGFPSLSGTLCGSIVMWLLLESFQLPSNVLFKTDKFYMLSRNLYIGLSPFILVSRFYLRYNTPGQVFIGYSLGSVVATTVFIFIKSTTLSSLSIKEGLFPLWVRLGLKNNLSAGIVGFGSREDYLKVIKLKKQAEPLRQACEELETQYHALRMATGPLIDSQKQSQFVSELLANKEMAAHYMTPEFEQELAELIKKKASIGEKFPQKQIVRWLTQTALGLAIMHSKYIMHRDLKPQNLFLTEEYDLKLGDFGISKEMKTVDRMTSTFCGTPYYMPPEVYRQESYSLEADIWALGCAFYETMTLAPPFEMSNNPEDKQQNLGDKILHGEPSPPLSPMYSEPLRKLILSMLNKAPNDRPTILEILRTDVIDECITSMIKEKPEIEGHIKEFVNLNSKPKKNPKTGVTALGLPPTESLDTEKSEKYPEYIIAEMLKTLELKTIKNGFLSKFHNAFTGEDFKEAFKEVKCAKDINYENWCGYLLKSKILLPLKAGNSKIEKDGVYTLAYVQEKPQRNDLFEGDEQPAEDINRTISDLMISANEIIKIYKEMYKDKDLDFNPFTVPDFLYLLRKSARLKKVDLVGFNKNERFCYLLNCFQIMSFYRICMETAGKSAAGGGLLSYVGLGKGGSYSFKLGTENYMSFTADDILHGVLRKNAKKYNAYFAQFKGGDPRGTLLSMFDKKIICFYYLEHCELKDVSLEKLEAASMETKLNTLMKNWTANNMYYNAVEKSINLPSYLDNNYLADYNSHEFEMVLELNEHWANSKFKRAELEEKLESQSIFVLYEPMDELAKRIKERQAR